MAYGISGRERPQASMPDQNPSSFFWSVADLLRGDYKQSDYGKAILLFTIRRRFVCALEEKAAGVLAEPTLVKSRPNRLPILAEARRSITVLSKRRSALISAAVTGQMNVRLIETAAA